MSKKSVFTLVLLIIDENTDAKKDPFLTGAGRLKQNTIRCCPPSLAQFWLCLFNKKN